LRSGRARALRAPEVAGLTSGAGEAVPRQGRRCSRRNAVRGPSARRHHAATGPDRRESRHRET
jgi:hypothetical protein